jgi:hypothetical protein
MIVGAMITGRAAAYRCARNNFITRTRYLLSVMGARATSLNTTLYAQKRYCADRLEEARRELIAINASTDADVLSKMLTRGTLSAKQQALYENACPVIG